jgi:hypothetical protein
MLAKTGEELRITWDAAVKQFKDLVHYMAWQRYRTGIDKMLSPDDLFQEGMIKLYDCWTIWCMGKNKDMDEFGPIFRISLQREMKGIDRKKLPTVDIEDTENSIADSKQIDVADKLYIKESLQILYNSLQNSNAKNLLRELVEPSDRTIFEVWADIKRKEMLKSQGKRVYLASDTTIRMKHIQRSLGITSKQYDEAMKEIRQVAKQVFND